MRKRLHSSESYHPSVHKPLTHPSSSLPITLRTATSANSLEIHGRGDDERDDVDNNSQQKRPVSSSDGFFPSESSHGLHGVFYKVEAHVQEIMSSFVCQVFRAVDWVNGAPLDWVNGRQMELRFQPYSSLSPLLIFDSQDHTSFSCVIPGTQKRCRVIAHSDGALTVRTNSKGNDEKFPLPTWDGRKPRSHSR
jgi:hypothetical protein